MKLESVKQFLKNPGDHNPVMTQRFGADPYAVVYDGRVYLYMTGDTVKYDSDGNAVENSYGDIFTISVVSSDDLVNWTDHGQIKAASKEGAAVWGDNSWAPAACCRNVDGRTKFFLYFANGGNGIAVLTADSPVGPFTDPIGGPLISRETPNCGNVTWLFDPAVLTDGEDSYLYVGGGVPNPEMAADPGTARVVKLGSDMISLAQDPQPIENVPYLFEDSGINKIGGRYVYTYCSNFSVPAGGAPGYGFGNGEIIAMESDSPEGPFKVTGSILKNPEYFFGLGGNNHHCIFEFKGEWYIAYHSRILESAMGISGGYRSTNIDKITLDENGRIIPVEATRKGVKHLKKINPYSPVPAAAMSNQSGTGCAPYGEESEMAGYGNMILSDICDGAWTCVSNVDFGTTPPEAVIFVVRGKSGGRIHVRLDSIDSEDTAAATVDETEQFAPVESILNDNVMGVHDIYFVFEKGGFEVEKWWLE